MLEELRKYRNATPFVPFTMHFRDGHQMRIVDTYHMAFGGKRLVVAYQEETDTFSRVDSEAVVQITTDVSPASN